MTYAGNLCRDRQHNWETVLGTSMNPLGLAVEYLKLGWNVRLVDMSGVQASERDISHVIGCEAMADTSCVDGWLKYHQSDTPHHTNPTKEDVSAVTASMHDTMSSTQLDEIEQLFRYRDCAYQSTLEGNQNFQVMEAGSIWKDCQADKLPTYQALAKNFDDVSTMYKGLLSQVKCPKSNKSPYKENQMISMDDIFSDRVVKLSTLKSKQTPTRKPDPVGKRNYTHWFQELVLFPLILCGVFAYQVHRMVKSHKRQVDTSSYLSVPQLDNKDGFEMKSLGQAQADAEYGDQDDNDDEFEWDDMDDGGDDSNAVVARL